ncbi:MAG: hypothetical protein VX278_22845, partial [Myxococcota bacterium]|nr:hypothetical protein [Myxococcota bacterium]
MFFNSFLLTILWGCDDPKEETTDTADTAEEAPECVVNADCEEEASEICFEGACTAVEDDVNSDGESLLCNTSTSGILTNGAEIDSFSFIAENASTVKITISVDDVAYPSDEDVQVSLTSTHGFSTWVGINETDNTHFRLYENEQFDIELLSDMESSGGAGYTLSVDCVDAPALATLDIQTPSGLTLSSSTNQFLDTRGQVTVFTVDDETECQAPQEIVLLTQFNFEAALDSSGTCSCLVNTSIPTCGANTLADIDTSSDVSSVVDCSWEGCVGEDFQAFQQEWTSDLEQDGNSVGHTNANVGVQLNDFSHLAGLLVNEPACTSGASETSFTTE